MQPHSMCAVALAGYVWNRPEIKQVSSGVMHVEYRKDGTYKKNIYRLGNIHVSPDGREIKVRIIRDGGGISCEITIRRSSAQEGSEVTMTHGQIHVAGLREVYNLYKLKVASGLHYNSERYRAFAGEFSSDRKKLRFVSEVKNRSGSFVPVGYELELTQVS